MPTWVVWTIYGVGALAGFGLYWSTIEDDAAEEPLNTPFWLRMVFLLGFTILWPLSFCLIIIFVAFALKNSRRED